LFFLIFLQAWNLWAINFKNSASFKICTPSSCALVSLEPASAPARTKSVFSLTLPVTLPPASLDLGRGFLARQRRQRAGQHKRFAGKQAWRSGAGHFFALRLDV
jgi:hypothetical protein